MSTNKKVSKFVTPNNPNASIFIGPTSTNARIRRNLNETICAAPTNSSVSRKPTPGSKKNDDIVNASICVASSSASSRIRRNLNETIRPGMTNPTTIKKPTLLSKKAIEDENSKLQLTFAYNEYLQSLMKQMIIEEKIKKSEDILNGQIQYYGDLLSDKQEQLDAIVADTNSLEKQKQVSINLLKLD